MAKGVDARRWGMGRQSSLSQQGLSSFYSFCKQGYGNTEMLSHAPNFTSLVCSGIRK